MKNKKIMRGLSVALVAAMAMTLTGCGKSLIGSITGQEPTGKTDNASTNASDSSDKDASTANQTGTATVDPNGHYFKVEYIKNAPDLNNTGSNHFDGDKFIYLAYNDDYTKTTLYSYDLIKGESKEYYSIESSEDYSDPTAVRKNCNSFDIDSEGNAYMYIQQSHADTTGVDLDFTNKTQSDCAKWMVENWGYESENDAITGMSYYEESEEYKDENGNTDYNKIYRQFIVWNLPSITENYVSVIGSDGVEKTRISVDLKQSDNGGSYCNNMIVDSDKNIYLAVNEYDYSGDDYKDEYYALVYDKDGNAKGKIESDSYFYTFVKYQDKIGVNKWDADDNYVFYPINLNTMSFDDPIDAGTSYDDSVMLDEKHSIVNENNGLFITDLDTQEKERLLSWLDCDISSSAVNTVGALSDGRICVYLNQWSRGDNNAELAILTEIPASEVTPKVELKMAVQYLDSEMENYILDFNRHSNDYRITVESFYYDWSTDDGTDDNAWNNALNDFYARLITDKTIDVICFAQDGAYASVQNMASKGLLIDMADIINKEGTLKTDKLQDAIVKGLTIDGKLVGVPGSVSYETVIGKTSDVGEKSGWTVDDMINLLKSKPAGTELFNGMTRDQALKVCLNLGYTDYIDMGNHTCDFNNESFAKVLELANLFPEEFDWDKFYEEYSSEYERIQSGEVLLYRTYLYDFDAYLQIKTVYGEDVTMIGFPSSNTNGTLVNLSNIYTITRNCEAPEKAWEAIAPYFARKYNDDGSYVDDYTYAYGVPVRKDDFEAYCKRAIDPEYNYSNGDVWINDTMVEGDPLTQADVDKIKDAIENASGIEGAISDGVFAIIQEEAGAYFSGQKSAADVAAIIQGRVQVYLSETE